MEIEQCDKEDCRKIFTVSEIGGKYPGTKEREEINCPHCGRTVRTASSNGVFQTNTATAEQSAEWLARLGDN